MKNEKISICPKCGSIDLEKKITIMTALGSPSPYTCNKCSYSSHIFPRIEKSKIAKFKNDIKK